MLTSVINLAKKVLSGTTDPGDKITASPLQVTKLVPFIGALAGGLVQGLASSGVITIATGDLITIWLVAAGLSVLLVVADIAARAYVTGSGLRSSAGVLGFDPGVRVDVDLPGMEDRVTTMTAAENRGGVELARIHIDAFDGKPAKDYEVPMNIVHSHVFNVN